MRKRLVYRADDIGYTKAFNDGAFKAIEEGIVTSADIMLDTPATIDALERIKNYPWISIGWHRHLWGSPVAGAENVPSMVNEQGRFKWRKNMKLMDTVTYEDAYREFKAQLELCLNIIGRVPDSAHYEGSRPIDIAMRDVCLEYNISCNFWGETSPNETVYKAADQRYQYLNYRRWPTQDHPDKHKRFDLAYFHEYDPAHQIMSVRWENDNEIWRVGGHPGYLDEYILAESTCNVHRVKDIEAVCSEEVKQWIIENEIELINQRDVLFNTSEYQNHLKHINSPLYIGNIKKENDKRK
ncbi:MAG: ChbG/HpnK family deacetylase [Erysipelotrichaceae bacterium]|nr:ChbG/HpnK family deacetylase [Erysipelotrichaceae bacterium]